MRTRAAGFTLVEVLVALVVFALGTAALLSAQTQQARTTAGLEQRFFAQVVAENVLLEALSAVQLERGVGRGQQVQAGFVFGWTRQVAPTGVPDVLRVEVQVRLADEAGVLADLTALREERR